MVREFAALIEQKALLPTDVIDAWSPLFTVEQATRSRVIFDLRALNESVRDPKFRMETLAHVPTFARGGKVMLKLDLRSAFHQYPVTRELSRFFGTCDPDNPDSLCRWTCLPLGFSRSPLIWSSLTSMFRDQWRACGIRVFVYVDDILIVADDVNQLADATEIVVGDLIAAGIRISAKKAQIAPFTSLDFLGLTVDLTRQAFIIPEEKLTKIAAGALELSSHPPSPSSLHELQSLIGRTAFAAVACPWLRFFTASLNKRLSPSSVLPEWSRDELEELLWWATDAPRLLAGRVWRWQQTAATRPFTRHSTHPIPGFYARCDASDNGIGLRYGSEAVWSEPLPSWLPPSSPSSARELYGICRLIEAGHFPPGAVIRVQCDNTGAVFTAMGSSATPLTARVARRYFQALIDHDVTVIVEWVSREELYDVDAGSRWDAGDLSHALLPHATRKALCDVAFGPDRVPDVLFFSSPHTRWVPSAAYCSRAPEPGSSGDGVGTEVWETCLRGWAYPPFALLHPTLLRISNLPSPPRAIVILPDTSYVRCVLRDWRRIPITLILSPPTHTQAIPPTGTLAAFISPSLPPTT